MRPLPFKLRHWDLPVWGLVLQLDEKQPAGALMPQFEVKALSGFSQVSESGVEKGTWNAIATSNKCIASSNKCLISSNNVC